MLFHVNDPEYKYLILSLHYRRFANKGFWDVRLDFKNANHFLADILEMRNYKMGSNIWWHFGR